MLRVVEIENKQLEYDDEEELEDDTGIGRPVCSATAPNVKFRSAKVPSTTGNLRDPVVVPSSKERNDARKRSPPPVREEGNGDDLSDEDIEDGYEDNDEDNGLSLQRFASATSRPPRMIPSHSHSKDNNDDKSSSSSSEDEDEPKSPPPLPMPTEAQIKEITEGEENSDLKELYAGVAGCPCHGNHEKAPVVSRAWDMPRDIAQKGLDRVVALVQVQA